MHYPYHRPKRLSDFHLFVNSYCDNRDGFPLVLLEPLNDRAQDWVTKHLPEDAFETLNQGRVVEHRHLNGVLTAVTAEGLKFVLR